MVFVLCRVSRSLSVQRMLTFVGGLLLLKGCATSAGAKSPAAAAQESRPAVSAPGRLLDGDQAVEQFLIALKNSDFAKATGLFGPSLKAGLSQDQLAGLWRAQTQERGPLVSWSITQRAQQEGREVRVTLLEFADGQLQALLSWNPQSQDLAGLFFKPVPKLSATPASYVNPSAFKTEEVLVGREPFVLKGTVALPVGPGPFPAVVLVHGSGPNDRDETVGANKPFKDIAEGLASRGIAVLRYDKRTFLYGERIGSDISIDDEVVSDAVSAVEWLKGRPEVDPRRVFVAGHSLGALLAPEIAVKSRAVAGVMLLAPPGRPPWDIVLEQLRYLDTPPEELAAVEKAVERLKAGKLGSEKLLGAPARYWLDWASRDGVSMTKQLGRPVLLLRGERDYQVTEADVAVWKKGLKGTATVEMVTIPGDNHVFVKGTGKPGPAEYDTPGHVDDAVIEHLVSFISRTKGAP